MSLSMILVSVLLVPNIKDAIQEKIGNEIPVWGQILAMFVILFIGANLSPKISELSYTPSSTQEIAAVEEAPIVVEEPAEPLPVESEVSSEEQTQEQIRVFIQDMFKGNNNMDIPWIDRIDVTAQMDGGWRIYVGFNADDYWTNKDIRVMIERRMSDVYTALYKSDFDIRSVHIAASFPFTDQYGNPGTDIIYKTSLDKEVADKINWDSDPYVLKFDTLPNLWVENYLSSSFQ